MPSNWRIIYYVLSVVVERYNPNYLLLLHTIQPYIKFNCDREQGHLYTVKSMNKPVK